MNDEPTDDEILLQMEGHGTSLSADLARVARRGGDDLRKIKASWPGTWELYAEFARAEKRLNG